jgi:YidC/Oxa1 family membrane protein insertase
LNLDKKSFLAVVVFSVLYFAYNHYLQTKYPNMGVPKEILQSQADTSGKVDTTSAAPVEINAATDDKSLASSSAKRDTLSETKSESYPKISKQDLTFDSRLATYTLDQKTGGFSSIYLKNYTVERGDSSLVNLVNEDLAIQPLVGTEAGPVHGFKAKREGNTISFERVSGAFLVTHSYTFSDDSYGVDIDVNYKNISGSAQTLYASMLMQDAMAEVKEADGGFLPGVPTGRPTLIASIGDDSEHFDAESYCTDEDEKGAIDSAKLANINVLGLDRHYFVKALVPGGQKFSYSLSKVERGATRSCLFNVSMGQDYGRVLADQSVSIRMKSFFGPKDIDVLRAYDNKLLDTVDLGWFAVLSEPLLNATKWLYSLTGNWGFAIILLTIFIKIIFYPLTKSAAIAMHKSKKLQPEMKTLKEKYKSDPRRQQQELMAFMAKHKINPMKGCLPMLPQMPVFFALYRVLSTAIELRHAPFMGWIVDLSAADPLYITPLVWGGTMFIQQKLTPSPGMDKSQQRIMMMLPAVFSVMMITLPSGMVLYMLTNTIVSIAQQKWLNKKLDAADGVIDVKATQKGPKVKKAKA